MLVLPLIEVQCFAHARAWKEHAIAFLLIPALLIVRPKQHGVQLVNSDGLHEKGKSRFRENEHLCSQLRHYWRIARGLSALGQVIHAVDRPLDTIVEVFTIGRAFKMDDCLFPFF